MNSMTQRPNDPTTQRHDDPVVPTVSVIIPAYNSAKYIGEAIESVLAQTYPVLEIIVIDDGSTDDTAKIVQEHVRAQEHKSTGAQVKYIYQNNKGPAAARNTGIRAATGDYIAFLDSDDTWLPEKIEKQLNKFEENNEIALVHTDRIRIGVNGVPIVGKRSCVYEGMVFDKLLVNNFICTSTVLAKKICFDESGLFDESSRVNRSEDYDMWLRIAHKRKTAFISEPLIKYRILPKSYSRSDIKISYDAMWAVFLKSLILYQGNKEQLKRKRLAGLMYSMGDEFFYSKEYDQASSALRIAIKNGNHDIRPIGLYIISKVMNVTSRGKQCL